MRKREADIKKSMSQLLKAIKRCGDLNQRKKLEEQLNNAQKNFEELQRIAASKN